MEIDKMPIKESLSGEDMEYVEKMQKEFKFIGKARKNPGHTLFSFNRKTKEIKVANVDKICELLYDGKERTTERINIEPDCFYGQALNRKNFIKRLEKLGFLDNKQK